MDSAVNDAVIPRPEHVQAIAAELSVPPARVAAVARLLDEGGTVPFIARYRKEATGSLDEVAVGRCARPAGGAGRAGQAARGHPRLPGRARPAHRRPASRAGGGHGQGAARRHLPAPSAQASHPGGHGPGARAGPRCADALLAQRGIDPVAEGAEVRYSGQSWRPILRRKNSCRTWPPPWPGRATSLPSASARTPRRARPCAPLFAKRGRFGSRGVKGKEEAGATYRDWFDWDEPLGAVPSHRALAMFRARARGHAQALPASARGRGPGAAAPFAPARRRAGRPP